MGKYQFFLFNAEMHNRGVHTKYLYIWYVILYYEHNISTKYWSYD